MDPRDPKVQVELLEILVHRVHKGPKDLLARLVLNPQLVPLVSLEVREHLVSLELQDLLEVREPLARLEHLECRVLRAHKAPLDHQDRLEIQGYRERVELQER